MTPSIDRDTSFAFMVAARPPDVAVTTGRRVNTPENALQRLSEPDTANFLSMVFLCGRPGCGRESSATLQIDAPSSTVSLVDPRVSRDGVPLCPHHADATTPPQGWTMNDLRSQNRTLAPVRPIGPKTGEIVSSAPRKRSKGNPLFRDSRPRSADPVEPVEHEPEVTSPDEPALTFPVSRDVHSMPVSASGASTDSTDQTDLDLVEDLGEDLAVEEATDGRSGNDKGRKAPASRPTRRREVLDAADQEDDKFPWHYQFDDDEPEELQAKTPLLSRAFRSSVG